MLLGLGYGFDWGEVSLFVRSLSYDFDDKDGDLRMTGPALGVSLRWQRMYRLATPSRCRRGGDL